MSSKLISFKSLRIMFCSGWGEGIVDSFGICQILIMFMSKVAKYGV